MKYYRHIFSILSLICMIIIIFPNLLFANSLTKIPKEAMEYSGNYYYVFPNICESWEEAKLYCESLGGHLAVINDEKENRKLYDLMKNSGYDNAYFGFSDANAEGNWEWVNNDKITYTNWDVGEPNNERGKEHYAMFYYKSPEYTWNDGDFENGTVNDYAAFICEWDNTSKTENEVKLYSGPGENYQLIGKINENEIQKYICEENNWIEVEYQNQRAYVRKSSLTNLDVTNLPYVIYNDLTVYGPLQRPHITFFKDVERKLTCETPIRSGPNNSYDKVDILNVGTTLKILYKNPETTTFNINTFLLVEYQTSDGLKRGYAEQKTVFDLNNPLRDFDSVKLNNAPFNYQGKIYYSTIAYPHALDGWKHVYSNSLVDYKFDFLNAVVGAISSNDNDVDLTQETWLYDFKADSDVSVNSNRIENISAFIDLFGMVNSTLENGNQNMAIQVDLETYEKEGRLIIRGGEPFEMRLSGKKDISLSSLIDKSGKATDVIRCKELADELIRSICPEISGNGKCDMLLTFSDDFSYDPYGYYFMIDKEGIVYSCIIIHQ